MTSPSLICPLCGNADLGRPWHHFTAAQAAAHFCPPTRNRERYERFRRNIASLWNGESAATYICPTCDFGFAYPFVGGDTEFYAILHEQAGYPQWRWEYGVVANEVLAERPSGGRILDIGTGDGSFLRPLGPQWDRHATESTPAAQERLRHAGIRVIADLASGAREAAGTFAVVTMFQALEHIAAFKSVLPDCRRLLAPQGTLAVSVPDRQGTLIQEEVTGCLDMPPNHVNKWSVQSLSRALADAGFQPRAPRIEPATWRRIGYAVQLKLAAKAGHPRTLAAQIYRVRHKPTRVTLLALAGAICSLGLLRSLPRLRAGGGGSLLIVADAV